MKFVTGVLIAFLLAGSVIAGTIDSGLSQKIANSGPDTKYPTLIFMVNQLDVAAMKHQHDLVQATRAQRHSEVIAALQRIATESQADLLAYLEQGKQRGTVGNFRGFWITNMIYAELTPSEIQAVAARGEVDIVYADFKGDIEKPVPTDNTPPPTIASIETGIKAIRADSMWAHGYTGQGRLVCNIDTGVDGNHPALRASWHGANGFPAAQSWFDTADPSNTFPHDEGQHGTHTMGTICGRSRTTPDTIGVAIDAQWIAARAVDVTGGNIIAAFQWAADPDGDPNTIEDVPDVISNSWGSTPSPGNECPPDFYNVIDNCEAAGTVVVFAAGNEGPTAGTLRIPANRITTPYNAFSVGAIDGNTNNFPITSFSSRGPSQCDNLTIKPEVVAPGNNVRSSLPGNTYGLMSGTSMACPHVAGAVALLRQVNPNASVDTIKWALMQSARDLPFSNPDGEDNTYGWGIIDVNAARALIPPINTPFLFPNTAYVVEPNDNYPDPGETINLFVRLKNTGILATNVTAIISSTDSYVNISQDSAFYGSIAQNDTARSSMPFVMAFDSTTPPGHDVYFSLLIRSDSGYQVTKRVSLTIGRLAAPGVADHNIGNVAFTVSNFGQYGLASDSQNPNWNGKGFKMPRTTGTNYLFEGSLLIGIDSVRVSNGARDENQNVGHDFQPITSIDTLQPGPFADQEHHSIFNDQGADVPLNISISQRSFAFAHAPDSNYIITEYTITNVGLETLNDVLVADFEDWDIPWGAPADRVNFDRARKLGYQFNGANYRGQQVLSSLGIFSFKALDNTNEVYPPYFTRADKWRYMNAGTTDTAITTNMDASMMITTGPYTLAPGDSAVAAFAILGGTSLTILRNNADAALAKYATRVSVSDDNINQPENFSLMQNYPNPFNAQTTIRFNTVAIGHIKLETFDILGRRVAILVDGNLAAGEHSVIWDCSQVPSGVYFYRLSDGKKAAAKKMTLLK